MVVLESYFFCAAVLLLALLAQGAPEQTAMQTATTGPIRPVSQTAMATMHDPGNQRHLMSLSRMHNADVKNAVDTTSTMSTTANADSTNTADNAEVSATLSAVQGTDTTNNADTFGLDGWGGGWSRRYYSYPHYHSYSGLGQRHRLHNHGWRRLLGAQ